MTDILCNWLNNDLSLSVKIESTNFAKEFATGYLIGEALSKYQLQDDFDQFSQSRTADSKLNNFTRLEPVLHLLEVPFDTNVARDVMTEKQGVATRLMYQLFIALNKKQKANLTGAAMETMRPAAPVKLEGVESLMYKERLKHLTPRQTDLNLEALVDRFHQKQIQLEQTAFRDRFTEEERHEQMLQDKRQERLTVYKNTVSKRSEMLAKIQAATVHIPKPPPNKTAKAIAMRKQLRREEEGEVFPDLHRKRMRRELDVFEDKLKRTLPPSKPLGEEEAREAAHEVSELPDSLQLIKPASNSEYINRIRKRLNEDSKSREEREKRRRKVLQDQLKAHEAQEEAKREELLVNRLMRQSQQERRIAVQLLQTRHEKEVIRNNRLSREREYEQRRLVEFEEALNREKKMAQLAKAEYEEQTARDLELHARIMAERAQEKYAKHYSECAHVLGDILDFSTKVAEYRELTNRLVPQKLYREWKALFEEGHPLYEQAPVVVTEVTEPTPEQILEEERQKLLDEGDFNEYRQMIGEWNPPEEAQPAIAGPPRDNPIVGHIVQRLFDLVHPPSPPPPPPEFPPFPIKACVMGKAFSGKSTCLKNLAESHRLQLLDMDTLVQEALEAHKNNEMMEIVEEEEAETPAPEMLDIEGKTPQPADTNTHGEEGTYAETPSIVEPSVVADSNKTQGDDEGTQEEGAEKTDPEKPVPEDEAARESSQLAASEVTSTKPPTATSTITKATSSKPPTSMGKASTRAASPPKPQPTPRAKLGAKALKILKKGRPLDDGLLVDIMVEAIKNISEGTGWVMDGFPRNQMQAKHLEKALTGIDGMSREMSREMSKAELKAEKADKKKKSKLVPDPKPQAAAPEPGSGLNTVILFDVSNEVCLKRAAGRTYSIQTNEQFQQEFKPPPEGSATGIGEEQVLPVEDASHDEEQLQHRLTSFTDSWPRLDKWYTKIGNLVRVDAAQEEETVYLEVERLMEEAVRKIQGIELEQSLMLENSEVKEEEEPPKEEKPVEVEPVVEAPPPEEVKDRSRPSSRKSGSRAGSAKRSGSGGSKDKKASRSGSKAESKKSAGSGAKSPKRPKSGKKGKTPEPEPEPEPEAPPGTPPPQPGTDEWVYVSLPLEDQLAHALSPYWEAIEETYIDSSKVMFRKNREERERIIRYLYQIRKDFQAYLRRPDHKQEFVSQWQKDFNSVNDDLRDDEETRGELHQRLDDLRETLWTICDQRKEQAEREKDGVEGDGWLDDRLGLLSNNYISLMQVEVDRYQDTVRLLKDYYRGMEGKIPDEQSSDYTRIPLIELPICEDPKAATEGDAEEGEEDAKSVASKSGLESKSKKSEEAKAGEGEEERKPRIPLLPRRPGSPDPAAAAAKAKADKAKGKNAKEEEQVPPPSDPDQKIIFHAHVNGIGAIDKIMAAEQAAREAEEAAEREADALKEAEKQKAAAAASKGKKGDKKGGKKSAKSRSPSPKKRGDKTPPPAPTPPPPEETESEEDKLKRLELARARDEFFAAVQEEAEAAKMRLQLVKMVGMTVLQQLKENSDSAYKDMNDWLGARFLKEMESIDQMSEVMRHAVENGTKIREELILEQQEFVVDEDMKTLKTPSPPPRPAPAEPVQPDCFTVDQIMSIYRQFSLIAPSGILTLAAFTSVFQDLTALTHGTEQIPDLWNNLSPEKLEFMTHQVSSDGECIDWRAFLLAAAQPWPTPSQGELLQALERFRDMDQKDTGYVTREQYDRVELWFRGFSKPVTPAGPSDPFPYDRLANLKDAFFDMFADHSLQPLKVDYVKMLLYFAGTPMAYVGFLRALSIVAGTHMPRVPLKTTSGQRTSRPTSRTSLTESLSARDQVEQEELPTEDVPDSAMQSTVPLDALIKVLHHGETMRGESHRFSVQADPDDILSRERLEGIYHELGSSDLDPIPYVLLIEHPIIVDIIASCNTYRVVDLKGILGSTIPEQLELQSMKTEV